MEANWNCPWQIGEHSPLNYEESVHVTKGVWMIKEDFSKSHVSLALGQKGIPFYTSMSVSWPTRRKKY